jgi:molybdopterin synthase catalytic subunit
VNVTKKLFEVTNREVSVDEVVARLADPAIGAVATFVGVVRGTTDGREVRYLEYEAYLEMAEKTLRQIGDEVRARWPEIQQVAIVHRTGRLLIGETAVVIALSAAHRRQVFDALRYAIDRLKEIVPIWKKEVWADGAEWKSEMGPPDSAARPPDRQIRRKQGGTGGRPELLT